MFFIIFLFLSHFASKRRRWCVGVLIDRHNSTFWHMWFEIFHSKSMIDTKLFSDSWRLSAWHESHIWLYGIVKDAFIVLSCNKTSTKSTNIHFRWRNERKRKEIESKNTMNEAIFGRFKMYHRIEEARKMHPTTHDFGRAMHVRCNISSFIFFYSYFRCRLSI